MQFDHIGLVVPDLASGVAYCRDVLGLSRFSAAVEDPLQRVWVQFVHDDHGLCYELVAPARRARSPRCSRPGATSSTTLPIG